MGQLPSSAELSAAGCRAPVPCGPSTPGSSQDGVVSDKPEAEERTVSKRGEAAWKEEKDRIAARNEQARKAGRQRRDAKDRVRVAARVAADRREMAEALGQHREQR